MIRIVPPVHKIRITHDFRYGNRAPQWILVHPDHPTDPERATIIDSEEHATVWTNLQAGVDFVNGYNESLTEMDTHYALLVDTANLMQVRLTENDTYGDPIFLEPNGSSICFGGHLLHGEELAIDVNRNGRIRISLSNHLALSVTHLDNGRITLELDSRYCPPHCQVRQARERAEAQARQE